MCGAGASSTFVALRVRRAAASSGLELSAFAGTEQSLPIDLDSADVVLLGPHLSRSLADVRALAAPRGVAVAQLPDDIFRDLDGHRALALAREAADRAAAHADAPATAGSPEGIPSTTAGSPEGIPSTTTKGTP
ncbi:hypothetical protein GCM10010921_07170 [Microbacterium album]|uniref:PTS EIIB type-3 domain-containing protein n=1 Tax=Microbacterium album TaxID=2053191 RepID=A0A917MKY1_9MICO|nr:hypothetical protein GCM10010921_07170 [Microbacterium album]